MNRWIPKSPAAPRPGAIMLTEDSPLGRAGQYIELDARGGGIMNLSTGAALPLAGGRQANGMMSFSGSPPGPTDVHTPIAIAGYLASYQNNEFLLDKVVQTQPVDYTQFVYRKFDQATTYLVQDARASELSAPPQTQFSNSTETKKTADLRMATFIPYRGEQQADFQYTAAAARNLWTKIMLWREYEAFKGGSDLMTSGNWAASVRLALGATENWGPPGSAGVDSDPIRDLKSARRASKKRINYFVMSLNQFDWFTAHASVIDYYKAFNPNGNTQGMLRDAYAKADDPQAQMPFEFDVPMVGKVLVHNVFATTDPATDATRFWPDDIVLGFCHSASMPPNFDVASLINFRLKNPTNGTEGPSVAGVPEGVPTNNGWRVRMIPVPLIGSGGDLMIVDLSELRVFTANDVGAYISGIS